MIVKKTLSRKSRKQIFLAILMSEKGGTYHWVEEYKILRNFKKFFILKLHFQALEFIDISTNVWKQKMTM